MINLHRDRPEPNHVYDICLHRDEQCVRANPLPHDLLMHEILLLLIAWLYYCLSSIRVGWVDHSAPNGGWFISLDINGR